MVNFANLLELNHRRSIQGTVAIDAAIAAKYEDYATMLEEELLAPAKQECAVVFANEPPSARTGCACGPWSWIT